MPGSLCTERMAKARRRAVSMETTGPCGVNCSTTTRGFSPFTRMVSVRDVMRTAPAATFTQFSDVAASPAHGTSDSTYTSCWSMPTTVSPNAMRSLCPIAMPGDAGSPAPITFQPGATRCAR